eukprot:TRINITY_DN44150_c0_g1_i1.p2 TRINITY_DN44150_c0_g1~~TRINITY_DN44150_c0_g1_i1.p2  ORF type:complete len:456 (-),score=48.69 TRINITY_DN44150_c0_g1_i1:77-1444(-)
MPGGSQDAENPLFHRFSPQTANVGFGVKRGCQYGETAILKIFQCWPFRFLSFDFHAAILILPVGNDNVLRQFIQQFIGTFLRRSSGHISSPPRIFVIQQHIVPHNHLHAIFAKMAMKIHQLFQKQRFNVAISTFTAGCHVISLIKTDMEVFQRCKSGTQFIHQSGLNPAGFRITEAPGPAVRFKERLQLRMTIQNHMFTGADARSGKHVVLDRHPELQSLFEPDGWTWCLSNPEARRIQTGLVDELCARFAPLEYFHIGFDEAYDVATCGKCRNRDIKALLLEQLMYFHRHLGENGMKMIMWHDMLLNYKDPRWTGYMAGGTPEERTYELLDELPEDIVIADWQYEYCGVKVEGQEPEWPTLKYFKDCGFPVLATSFNSEAHIRSLGRKAVEQRIFGILGTSWHLLSNSMYEVYYNTAQTAWGHPVYCKHARLPFNTHLRHVARDMGIDLSLIHI